MFFIGFHFITIIFVALTTFTIITFDLVINYYGWIHCKTICLEYTYLIELIYIILLCIIVWDLNLKFSFTWCDFIPSFEYILYLLAPYVTFDRLYLWPVIANHALWSPSRYTSSSFLSMWHWPTNHRLKKFQHRTKPSHALALIMSQTVNPSTHTISFRTLQDVKKRVL